jgi:hypothetical protein
MCDLLTDPYIAQLRMEHRMENQITVTRKPAKWPERLAAPVDPLDTFRCARAQSLLTGGEFGVCPPLNPSQAVDVLRWAGIAV